MSLFGLFDRAVAVEVGPEGGSGVRLADLRASFRIEHKSGKTPATAKVRIWNPAPASIALLRVPLAVIRVFAGYAPIPRMIFQGSPVKDGVRVSTEGPDRILEVEAGDGGRAFVGSTISVGWSTATTLGQALVTILTTTGWARGYIGINEAQALPHGITYVGRPAELLDRLAASVLPFGSDWYVRDGALYMVPRGQAAPDVAPLISSVNGNLIGSSSHTDAGGVACRALLDSSMRPGHPFVLSSLNHQGTYVARDVTFVGDSGFDRPFYMDLRGKPLGAP